MFVKQGVAEAVIFLFYDANIKEISMKRTIWLLAGASLFGLAATSMADDHLNTATGAGGLTTSSQPFINGTNNPGRPGTSVPGQGSPLSGEDRTVPAVGSDTLLTHHFTLPNTNANPGNGKLRTPPPAKSGMTVPMGKR
jgi:hypothetical protein